MLEAEGAKKNKEGMKFSIFVINLITINYEMAKLMVYLVPLFS